MKDWIIDHAELKPGDRYYPLHVRGVNLNSAPGEYGREFGWNIPMPDPEDGRYDFTHAEMDEKTRAALECAGFRTGGE